MSPTMLVTSCKTYVKRDELSIEFKSMIEPLISDCRMQIEDTLSMITELYYQLLKKVQYLESPFLQVFDEELQSYRHKLKLVNDGMKINVREKLLKALQIVGNCEKIVDASFNYCHKASKQRNELFKKLQTDYQQLFISNSEVLLVASSAPQSANPIASIEQNEVNKITGKKKINLDEKKQTEFDINFELDREKLSMDVLDGNDQSSIALKTQDRENFEVNLLEGRANTELALKGADRQKKNLDFTKKSTKVDTEISNEVSEVAKDVILIEPLFITGELEQTLIDLEDLVKSMISKLKLKVTKVYDKPPLASAGMIFWMRHLEGTSYRLGCQDVITDYDFTTNKIILRAKEPKYVGNMLLFNHGSYEGEIIFNKDSAPFFRLSDRQEIRLLSYLYVGIPGRDVYLHQNRYLYYLGKKPDVKGMHLIKVDIEKMFSMYRNENESKGVLEMEYRNDVFSFCVTNNHMIYSITVNGYLQGENGIATNVAEKSDPTYNQYTCIAKLDRGFVVGSRRTQNGTYLGIVTLSDTLEFKTMKTFKTPQVDAIMHFLPIMKNKDEFLIAQRTKYLQIFKVVDYKLYEIQILDIGSNLLTADSKFFSNIFQGAVINDKESESVKLYIPSQAKIYMFELDL